MIPILEIPNKIAPTTDDGDQSEAMFQVGWKPDRSGQLSLRRNILTRTGDVVGEGIVYQRVAATTATVDDNEDINRHNSQPSSHNTYNFHKDLFTMFHIPLRKSPQNNWVSNDIKI
mgnify:CR=1 FL=1